MWNNEEDDKQKESTEQKYDNDPVRSQARDTAEKAAKQKKETEDKLRRSVEKATEKAKEKTAKLVANAAEKQKQETLEELQKSPDNLNVEPLDLSSIQADIASSVSMEIAAEVAKDEGIEASKGVETQLPQAAYDEAYKTKYEDTARIIGSETDAARDSEPVKAGNNQSIEGVITQMADEMKREGVTKDTNLQPESTLNNTLDSKSEWSSYRSDRSALQEETSKATEEIYGSVRQAKNGNVVDVQKDMSEHVKVSNSMPEEERKRLEADIEEANKKVKEAAAEELVRSRAELENVRREMAQLKAEEAKIASEGNIVDIARKKGIVAAADHFIRDASNASSQYQTSEKQAQVQALQAKLRDTSSR